MQLTVIVKKHHRRRHLEVFDSISTINLYQTLFGAYLQ